MSPLVSILIPVHNAAPWLTATLESALAQTWSPIEIIVVENGSTDATMDIALKFADRGVRIYAQQKAGAAAARNRAYAESHGEFIQYLDADDLLSPNKLTSQLAVLQADVSTISLSARVEFFDGDDPFAAPVQRDWPFVASEKPAEWLAALLGTGGRGGFVALHQWLTPRHLIDEAGPWDENLTVNDDGEFFSRVLLRATAIRPALAAVAYYRRYHAGANLSSAYRGSREHLESMLRATDLIAQRLLEVNPDPRLPVALARHYYECAFFAHPLQPELSRRAERQALTYFPAALPPPPTSKKGALVRRLLGWRGERYLAHLRNRNRKIS